MYSNRWAEGRFRERTTIEKEIVSLGETIPAVPAAEESAAPIHVDEKSPLLRSAVRISTGKWLGWKADFEEPRIYAFSQTALLKSGPAGSCG